MKEVFAQSPIYNSDCYVADYSEHDRINHISPSRKVCVDCVMPPIDHFHLVNRQGIDILAVNFEQYPEYRNGHNCEAMLTSLTGAHRPWVLFIELKYCQPHNPGDDTQLCLYNHCSYAIDQLRYTFARIAEKGVISRKSHNIYANFVAFGLDVPEPFTAFNLSQDAIIAFKDETGITLLGNQSLLAATASHVLPILR